MGNAILRSELFRSSKSRSANDDCIGLPPAGGYLLLSGKKLHNQARFSSARSIAIRLTPLQSDAACRRRLDTRLHTTVQELTHGLVLECDGDFPSITRFCPDRAFLGVGTSEVANEFFPSGQHFGEVTSRFGQFRATDIFLIKFSLLQSYPDDQQLQIRRAGIMEAVVFAEPADHSVA